MVGKFATLALILLTAFVVVFLISIPLYKLMDERFEAEQRRLDAQSAPVQLTVRDVQVTGGVVTVSAGSATTYTVTFADGSKQIVVVPPAP
jgi:hypothetical protein